MSNQPYDTDPRTVSREPEQGESRMPKQGVLPSRSARQRSAEIVNDWPSAEQEQETSYTERRAPLWARMLFWIFRKSIGILLMIFMLLTGLYIGYVILGGQPKEDVFEWSTWKHMWDLIFADS